MRLLSILTTVFLVACGGGGSSAPEETPTPTPAPTTQNCNVFVTKGPYPQIWPTLEWNTASLESQGMCPDEVQSVIDYAFLEGNDTGAIIVIRNGYIVIEEYDSGKTENDLATSWSVGKSFASALMGVALEEGLVSSLDETTGQYFPEWSGTERENISIRNLMTLRTGLEADCLGPPNDFDNGGNSIYFSLDQVACALNRELQGPIGEKLYSYSNSDVMLAGEIMEITSGMKLDDYLDQKLGSIMNADYQWWEDAVGNSLGYCCIDATPRDFGRFGLLFARNGEWNGQQLIPQSWIELSTSLALNGEYGYYWWPINGHNGFVAIGLHGQTIAVIPEDNLVIMRFGNYSRLGDGSTVRAGTNGHSTSQPLSYDITSFIDRVTALIR
ncbi:MAG: serine hydrolase [SAR86 cluster bacterium]|jgi:CubicO group peptidase (beta-lactamase class C family)|nr:serine hydrolase [SAR86 cluster bacterium]